ncbi:MAG: adenylate/guanylate cyclase domain-containing protein [Chloroflexota bacterium]
MRTLLSPQWRVFYLTLLVGLITGTITSLMVATMIGDVSMARPSFWFFVAISSVLFIGFPHYVLFKIALRRQLGRFLKLFYGAVERPAPRLEHWSRSRELDDLDSLFAQLLNELREYIDRSVSRGVELERLQRYFSPAVVGALADEAGSGLDRVSKMRVTVLFSDIRGFTPMSAKLSPDEVVEFLNEYFTVMIARVQEERGTVLKLIGDAVMAVFGAPTSAPDDTERALRVGCAMQDEFRRLEEDWRSRGKEPPLGMGVGINCGEVVVGNIGSPHHLDYTVIGDTVNVASRLCGVATPGQVLVSSDIVESLRQVDGVELAYAGEYSLKGKDLPVMAYEARRVA